MSWTTHRRSSDSQPRGWARVGEPDHGDQAGLRGSCSGYLSRIPHRRQPLPHVSSEWSKCQFRRTLPCVSTLLVFEVVLKARISVSHEEVNSKSLSPDISFV